MGLARRIGAVLTTGIILTGSGCDRGREPQPRPAPTVVPRGDLAADELSTIELFRNASPSVVFITSIAWRRNPFRMNVDEIPQGAGSGFLWDSDGHVITNFHVIQNASAAKVTLADNTTWDARLVGTAPDQDLAVLHIDAPAEGLQPLPLGTSEDLLVGQKVFAIGNPFGLDHTLTTGIISALGREITTVTGRTIGGVIQTDAAINPGNSGGPLLDSAGRMIGMNTAIYSPSGTSSGVGFAVPMDTIRRLVPQLIETGRPARAGLGVQVANDHIARRARVRGVIVMEVTPGSAAAAAGIRGLQRDAQGSPRVGDVIVGIDSKAVADPDDLADALDEFAVGDTVRVTLDRDGERVVVPVVLQEVASP